MTFESSEARMGERAPTDFIFQPYRELEAEAGERDWRELYNYVGNPLRPG